jgi:DNA-binding PadR family transcriptional regulator
MTRAVREPVRQLEDEADGFLPLKPAEFHVLLTLVGGAVHGYAIRQEVEARTGGGVRLWPATLYGTIGRLADGGLIEEVRPVDAPPDDVHRRFYALTALGRAVVDAETERLARLVELARAKQALAGPGPA